MLTLHQAYEVQSSIFEYLKATYGFREREVAQAFERFIKDEREGMFKGPYVSLKLPFVKSERGEDIPLDIRPSFPAFDHQVQAFRRLSTREGHVPQPTLLTTGTGSGKTESFLFPLLDYCYREAGRRGVKCIILYPMNALATDQAGRLAKTIWQDNRLKGVVTAGLFVGIGKDGKKYPKDMAESHIIENRDSILDSPPDILLTNFKMLDYALMRDLYQKLWQYNIKDPGLLRFLVLDELHTYDGAQGTDVANLIRRLKLKLDIPADWLCPIGTSATLGEGDDAPVLLAQYASRVFGENITREAIISEKRVGMEDFFGASKESLSLRLPTEYKLQATLLQTGEDYEAYVRRQLDVWQLDPAIDDVALSLELKKLRLMWDIVEICSKGMFSVRELIQQLALVHAEFRQLPEWDEMRRFSPREAVLRSIFSLIAGAKITAEVQGGLVRLPLLYLQVQLWMRELSGILRHLSETPAFTWRDKAEKTPPKAFPPYFCRECGASGWIIVKHDNRNHFEHDPADTYQKYFSNHKNIFFVNTDAEAHRHIEEYAPSELLHIYASKETLSLNDKSAPGRIGLYACRVLQNNRNVHICPECNSRNTLSIIGGRISTLGSVAVSQLLASDLDAQEEKDRKLLIFSNGVQDAAHLAGYVEARNYRFSFRTALQKVVNLQDAPVPLNQLQQEFIAYWKRNAAPGGGIEAYLYKFFPSDRSGEIRIAAYKRPDESFKASFVKEFDERLRWEIAAEFGFNAAIGRTLEKTGASAVRFRREALDKVFPAMQRWLTENHMQSIDKEAFDKFLNAFLHRVRIRGGIDHPYLGKYRTQGLRLWELNWMNDKRHYMNQRFGPQSRFPRLLTGAPDNRGLLDSTFTRQDNWFHSYFRKCFQYTQIVSFTDAVNEFFQELIKVLCAEDVMLLDLASASGVENCCIVPSAIEVGNNVSQMDCTQCAHRVSVESASAPLMEGAKCLQYRCTGYYRLAEPLREEYYYKQVYNRRRAPRVYAGDHTGLLERKTREKVEYDFKNRPRFNSLNALVATSTLEMGIDIGDLNITINSDVPPLPANFLQRVGRAGRKSGSALIINFAAAGEPHDLYYYEEPVEMMQGKVSTPGCYLDAREILKRHFFAYCMDCWVMEGPEMARMPVFVRHLKLAQLDIEDPQFFLNRLFQFIQKQEQELLDRFAMAYAGQVDDKVFKELGKSLRAGQFYIYPKKTFQRMQAEYKLILQKRQEIDNYIKEKKLGKDDDEHIALDREKRNLYGTLKAIEKRHILEFMTNAGILPNYAFPETGVVLNARISASRSEDSDALSPAKDIELVRPARQAIKELMPGSHFYTQGYKLHISGLNVVSWKEEAETFRFCSSCDHIMEDAIAPKTPCPKCGHDSWASSSNVHTFLKFQAVKSFNNEAVAKLDDSSEERERKRAYRSRHFKFNAETVHGAYALKNIPFGIEFVREVEVIEVNAGMSTEFLDRNRVATIAGIDAPVHGFITCKYCGLSSSTTHKKGNSGVIPREAADYHYAYCKNREKSYQGRADEVFEEVYLYRSMKTEALKILLPVQEFDSENTVGMFRAGLEKGIRQFYKGNPQHLEIREYSEFNPSTRKMDRYLVLFDTIPGGTGYLEKLFNKEAFSEVLQKAYSIIRDCACRHLGKDGCYHCIFSYANQYERGYLSRGKAEAFFQKIVNAIDSWESYPSGLSRITNTGYIEESELEERFLRALRVYAAIPERKEKGYLFEPFNQDGEIWYRFRLSETDNTLEYIIQPQYRLGPSQGIKYTTVADFRICCEYANIGGRELSAEELQGILPVAVYLDGYQYHASKENLRFENDLKRRRAIVESGQYLTWTLTWEDITRMEEGQGDELHNTIMMNSAGRQLLARLPKYTNLDTEWLRAQNNLSRLIWLLSKGAHKGLTDYRKHFRFLPAGLQMQFSSNFWTPEDAAHFVQTGERRPCIAPGRAGEEYFEVPIPKGEYVNYRMAERLKNLDAKILIHISASPEGYPKEEWERFWNVYNLFQVEEPELIISFEEAIHVPVATDQPSESAAGILAYYDEPYNHIVRQLLANNISFSQDGSFIIEENGTVAAEAVIGFETNKQVFGPISEDDAQAFRVRGYSVCEPEDFDIQKIRTL